MTGLVPRRRVTDGRGLLLSLGAARGVGQDLSILVHPAGGGLVPYLPIAARLATRGPVKGIRAAGLLDGEHPHDDLMEMAHLYNDAILDRGALPRLLFGWSMGGVLAWEISALLSQQTRPPTVVMIDSMCRPSAGSASVVEIAAAIAGHGIGSSTGLDAADRTIEAHVRASMGHTVSTTADTPSLLLACGEEADPASRLGNWSAVATSLTIDRLPGGHFDVFEPAVLPLLLDRTDRFLDSVAGGLK